MAELLENDNKHIKENEVHILAKSRSPIDLLENLCIEGTRKQAKCAVKAIVADFRHDALSSLYKRLVDMLGSDEHLPTVLQSLGCIAQTAMPIFKTREDDVIKFIWHKLLRKSSILADISETGWHDRSKECFFLKGRWYQNSSEKLFTLQRCPFRTKDKGPENCTTM
jgi:sister-chromatid-cohesion protein PDS5